MAPRRRIPLPYKGDLFEAPPAKPTVTPAMLEAPIHTQHRYGQDTSRRALKKTVKSRANAAAATLETLRSYGRLGSIPEHIAIAKSMELIDVRRHFSVLKKKQLIEPTGEEIVNDKGNACMVWRVK